MFWWKSRDRISPQKLPHFFMELAPSKPGDATVTEPYVFEREQWVPASLDQVFRFFSDAGNLELLTPQWLRFQILTPQPIHMFPGTLIDYRLHWHGIPMRWRTQITAWQPPHAFEDLQLKGPYKLWRHIHRFQAVDGGTLIRDRVEYLLPFGIVGGMVHAFSVRRNVERIFAFREQKVEGIFGSGKAHRP